MTPMIPSPGPLPIPAPAWLLLGLLVFTFILHVLFMNALFGGTLLTAFSAVKGKRDPDHAFLAKSLAGFMPPVVAFTVTLGVAPLLFLQALYGHFMYTSSILTAFAWFSVVPLVIIGYYAVYFLSFKWDRIADFRTLVSWIAALIFCAVGFIYVSNLTLMLRPDSWAAHYFSAPGSGKLNWGDLQLYPRYLHMLLGAAAVSGMWILLLGARKRTGTPEWQQWAVRYGAKIFVYATAANILIGFWFVIAHPKEVFLIFMGQNTLATALLGISILTSAGMLFIVHKAGKSENPAKLAYVGAGHLLAVLVMMAVMREQLRQAYLKPYFSLSDLPVQPQWGVFGIFAVLLILGIAVAFWMLKAAATQQKQPAPAAVPEPAAPKPANAKPGNAKPKKRRGKKKSGK